MPLSFRMRLFTDPQSITREETRGVARAMTKAFRDGADQLRERGRAELAGLGGKFQRAWIVRGPRTVTLRPRIFAHHQIYYAGSFQEGETVSGRPFLWLPIKQNLPSKVRRPKDFSGPLRGGRRGGPPILFGQVAVNKKGKALKRKPRAGAKARMAWLPVFKGVRTVRIPKRFDLIRVAVDVATEIGSRAGKVID